MRRWMLLLSAVIGIVWPTVTGATTAHASTTGTCVRGTNDAGVELAYYCNYFTDTPGPRGAIGVVGDSLFVGASPTVSSPSLPADLAAGGWGPIRMTAAVAMRTHPSTDAALSATQVVGDWQRAGEHPRVVAVNIGMAYLGQCTVDACASEIAILVDAIHAAWPDAVVWWAKIVHRAYPSNEYSDGMLTWNAALEQVAAQRPGRMLLWDWPTALAASDIVMDFGSTHPATPTEYAKRSALIAAHISSYMPARYQGPRIAIPSTATGALEFVPQRDTAAAMLPTVPLLANTPRSIDVARSLPPAAGTNGVVLTVVTLPAPSAGVVQLHPCGRPTSPSIVIRFPAGRRRSSQAVVPLTSGTTLCARSSAAVSLRVSVQGALVADGGVRFVPRTPVTVTVAPTAAPGVGRIQAPVLSGNGSATVAAAAVTVSVDGPSGGGQVTVHECGVAPPTTPTVVFGANGASSGSAYVPVSGGAFCITAEHAGAAPRVRVGLTGVFAGTAAGARFRFATTATRLLDMRPSTRRGGWYGRQVALQTLGLPAATVGGAALVGSITAYSTLQAGDLFVHPKGSTGGGVPALAFDRGAVASTAGFTVAAGVGGAVNVRMRAGNAWTAVDVVGWWAP